jgi:hypothetical protein
MMTGFLDVRSDRERSFKRGSNLYRFADLHDEPLLLP